MKKKKIFLASSSELADDRRQFEIFIGRENKKLIDKGYFLELIIWEDFIDAMSITRLQEEYNKAIIQSDIFIGLFFRKVGKYTEEEFDTAFGQFQSTKKPLIFTYFKDTEIKMSEIDETILSLISFKKKLDTLGHFYSSYKNIAELKYKFKDQLEKLFQNSFSVDRSDLEKTDKSTITITQNHSGTGDIIGGDKIINN